MDQQQALEMMLQDLEEDDLLKGIHCSLSKYFNKVTMTRGSGLDKAVEDAFNTAALDRLHKTIQSSGDPFAKKEEGPPDIPVLKTPLGKTVRGAGTVPMSPMTPLLPEQRRLDVSLARVE